MNQQQKQKSHGGVSGRVEGKKMQKRPPKRSGTVQYCTIVYYLISHRPTRGRAGPWSYQWRTGWTAWGSADTRACRRHGGPWRGPTHQGSPLSSTWSWKKHQIKLVVFKGGSFSPKIESTKLSGLTPGISSYSVECGISCELAGLSWTPESTIAGWNQTKPESSIP